MDEESDIAAVAAAIADERRAAMALALLGGERLPAKELARVAGVSPSGATAHLRRLLEAGLVVDENAGRHRFFRLAGSDVADALESLARVAPLRPVTSLRRSEAMRALKAGRTCYDHLAGELGVAVTDALVANGSLRTSDSGFTLTSGGAKFLTERGIDLEAARSRRRSLARSCLDWTERRPHLAGALGAALADLFFTNTWIRRLPGGRAVALTPKGRAVLETHFSAT